MQACGKGTKNSIWNYLPRSCAPVDDTGSGGRHQTVRVDVGHDIVTPALLLKSSRRELIILNALVLLQLVNGFL